MSVHESVAGAFATVDAAFRGIRNSLRGVRGLIDGPLARVIGTVILLVLGAVMLLEDVGRVVDRAVAGLEKWLVSFALAGMTFLAFNEYLQRELKHRLGTSMGGLWDLEGQMNLALLLMVVVGFFGASMATREHKHISVDAVERVLSPASARFVKRITATAAGILCAVFSMGARDAVLAYSRDPFEGVKVWSWMAAPINGLTALLPYEKFGPGTEHATLTAWEDAKYDADLDPFDIPSFGFVEVGDRFPLWIPLALLVVAFGIMAVRFFVRAVYPPPPTDFGPTSQGTRRPADVVLAGAFPAALITMALGIWLGQGAMIIVAALLLVFLGAPLFVGLGVGTVAAWVLIRNGSPETVVNDMFEATKKQELLAIPFFVLAGNLMTEGSIAKRLIEIARVALGRLPGGLGVGAVLSCAFFAAISGSSPVTVIAIGSIIFPMLIADGYDEDYAIGVLSSAGSLGIIIPPSIPMIVYAIIVGGNPKVGPVDPTVLFKAGILPGMFIALVLIAYTFFVSWPRPGETRPQLSNAPTGPMGPALRTALRRGLPSLMLPLIVLGGIYGWVDLRPFGIDFQLSFTVTEAAAVAVVYALFVELVVNRELEPKHLPKVFADSAMMMGSLFLILVIAISLNRFFVFEQVPDRATAWMLEHVSSQFTFLIMVNLFLLALGCVMDILSAILIVAPLLAPIAASYGIHPIHFGIMFIVNLELGYLTPPMGINLFVASTVFDRPILQVIRAVIPFLLLMLFCLAVIIWFPWLSLALIE